MNNILLNTLNPLKQLGLDNKDCIWEHKLENFNYLNVAFISYKLIMWDWMLFLDDRKLSSRGTLEDLVLLSRWNF